MACSSSCKTQDHASYGECMRSKGIRTTAIPLDVHEANKKQTKTLDKYAEARRYGIQPKSTRHADVENAVRISEATGEAFQA